MLVFEEKWGIAVINQTKKKNQLRVSLLLFTIIVAINKSHFQSHYVIGKGGFGRVWRVEKKKDRKQYAMKEMSKARILSKRSVNSVLNERKILNQLRHQYLALII